MIKNAQEIGPNIWHSPDTSMIMFDLCDTILAEEIEIDGDILRPKQEYHTTLVSLKREERLLRTDNDFLVDFTDFLTDQPVELDAVGDERYVCQKGVEKTVIAPVYLYGEQALKGFIREYFPHYAPFFHVTLLKNDSTEHGIRISSEHDLAERCAII